MMRLASLHVYPIKSARGIAPESWLVDEFGLQWDRRWMLVDADGLFVSQRDHPRLALIVPEIRGDALRVTAPGMQPIELPLDTRPDAARIDVTIWKDRVQASEVCDDADAWFSSALAMPVRLVFVPSDTLRPVDPDYALTPQDRVSFADAFPFLIAGSASLAELNSRLAAPLPMNRFRPNLVVDGSAPFEEDSWTRIRVGALEMAVVKPCARCVVTTIDQETGDRGAEPLRTLAEYRRQGSKVMFGQNAIHLGTGVLSVGDTIEVQRA